MQRRFSRRKKITTKRFRTNTWIKVPEIVVIDAAGKNIGPMKTADALQMAQEQELDLIEVSPLAKPPVCRIMNLGQWQYQQSQKTKKQKKLDTKVIRISFKIGDHDRQVKLNQANKFLAKGHKVKLELRLKGREKAYSEKAKEMVQKFINDVSIEHISEQDIKRQGATVNGLISKKS